MLNLARLTGTPGLPGAGGADYPPTRRACAEQWATALGAYAAQVVPTSATVAMATAALANALDLTFGKSSQQSGWTLVGAEMDQALHTWASAIALGMMAGGWSGAPPLMPAGFGAMFAQPYPHTRDAAVKKVAARIDQWMKTGTATQLATPYAVVPWS